MRAVSRRGALLLRRSLRLLAAVAFVWLAFSFVTPSAHATVSGQIQWGGTPLTLTNTANYEEIDATFNGTAGQVIYLDFGTSSLYYYNQLKFYSPSGVLLQDTVVGAEDFARYTLPETGT